MRTKSALISIAILGLIATTASAGVYDIHVGGVCSTGWTGGKGGGYLGSWPGETSISAPVDQNSSLATATTQLAQTLDTYCTGTNTCYVYTYSNGSAILSRALSLYSTAWRIGYVLSSAGNDGGSEIGGTGWVGELFGPCYLAGHIGPSTIRNGWNHHDTNNITIGNIGGNGWLAPALLHAVLPGHDDGAVAHHSSGGYASAGSFDHLCGSGRWTGRQTWWSCEYPDHDHVELKMKGICNDGGATGCK
jgi:hypothetical protein